MTNFWSKEESLYDARIIVVSGIIPWLTLSLNSIVDFFLCFERCLIIIFPILYSDTKKRNYTFLGFTIVGFIGLLTIFGNKVIESYPLTPNTSCRFITCLIKNTSHSIYFRIFSIILNVITASWLLILIKFSLKAKTAKTKRMNNIVLFMTIIIIVFELIPIVFSQILLLVCFITCMNKL